MRNTLETRLGIFVALTVIAVVLILETLGGVEKFKPGYRLYSDFNTVQELKEGDRVRMGGVEIGRVQDINLTNNRVRVTMKIHADRSVRTDSAATVKFTGLLGQNFVEISFGSPGAPRAVPDSLLESREQPDLASMMQKIDDVASGVQNITKSFSGDQINNLLGPFTDFLKQNGPALTATIANMRAISTQVSEGKGTVGKLIYDDSLYNSALATVTNLQATTDDVKLTLADARKIVDQVNSGKGSLGKLLHDEALYNETVGSMTNLNQILQKINQGQGTVGKLINDQEFYKNAKLSLQKIDKATEGLEDQGPLSVLGIAVNSLF